MTREEAIKILKAIRVYECYPKSASEETKEAIDMAIEALSAEVVEVVRCKDCRLYEHIGCAIEIKDDSDKPKPDDFCSFGEKRGGADGKKKNTV